jgi:hypothetical protein
MGKVAKLAVVKANIEEVKAKMADTSQQYIPVAKADDPWTTWEAAPVATAEQAVETVKQVLGGTTVEESCVHGARVWRTGTSKAGKPYGAWYCSGAYNGVLLGAKERCDPNWYEISKDGTWKPQVKRG